MRNEQTHPADQTAHAHAGGGDGRGCRDDEKSQTRNGQAQTFGFVFGKRKRIEFPSQDPDCERTDHDKRKTKLKRLPVGPRQRPHEPERDGGQFILRVGRKFHQTDE